MSIKVKKSRELEKLGKFLGISPPSVVTSSDVKEFKEHFESQLQKLIGDDAMSSTRGQLLPAQKSTEQEQLKKLGTFESESLLLDDLVRGMTSIWLGLRSTDDRGFDSQDLIAKLILLSNLIRRRDPAKAFGSRSKEDRDEILIPALSVGNNLQKLGDRLESSELPEEIHLQFLDSKASFEKFTSAINRYAQTVDRDESLLENLYASLIAMIGSKPKATELINCLSSDLQSIGFKVRDKFEHKKWTRQVRENKRNRTKAAPNTKRR